ncbi:Uncharacterised protein [Segatella copri]|nr:Uncharacterised protein [Segatella copri]
MILVAGTYQHPLLTNSLEDVVIQFFYVDLFHLICSFLFKF